MIQPPPLQPNEPIEALTDTSFGAIFEALLKAPHNLILGIRQQSRPGPILSRLLMLGLAGLLIFGITIGSFSFHEQLWAAPLKTALGIAFSTIICLPSLYVFSALTGTSLGLKEIVQGMAGMLALIAALLLGFTPVLWVFSQSIESESFFGTLVVVSWLIAVLFGAGFLHKMLKQSGTVKTGPLNIWIGIFLLVTLQMSTTLRPLIGRSDEFLSTEKRFFLEHWLTHDRRESYEVEATAFEGEHAEPETDSATGRGVSTSNPYFREE